MARKPPSAREQAAATTEPVDEDMERGGPRPDLTAGLLVVSFAGILLGIILTYSHLRSEYDVGKSDKYEGVDQNEERRKKAEGGGGGEETTSEPTPPPAEAPKPAEESKGEE
ncbi:MAG: hypothetical protein L0216_16660 [Planctomycetales bacterium]|nr:hypothetical protein [Planctomycetales bacterium]